ncbi:MAG TPA: DUF3365 domain-containing protein [Nitrospiraceae bacterium]|jgi:hypothetical protein|nr:DUF3365 domain-containing protein [Nitrospiraceae bacterium]
MNRSGLWVVAAAVAGFIAAVTYWVIALALAESRKVDMVSPERVTGFIQAIIEANRANYTQNVVEKLHNQGVVEAVEHWKEEKGLPLPAQFLLESGRLVAQKDLKFSFRLASLTPIYVWNGPNSEFERRGLEAVAKSPDNPFTGYFQQGGVRYFQGIYADRAVSETCVSCHNAHANSPRRDYKLNDVMGGLIVTIPITETGS